METRGRWALTPGEADVEERPRFGHRLGPLVCDRYEPREEVEEHKHPLDAWVADRLRPEPQLEREKG